MNVFLFGIGILGFLIGLLLTLGEAKGLVNASTQFGKLCRAVGPVVIAIGLGFQAISVRF